MHNDNSVVIPEQRRCDELKAVHLFASDNWSGLICCQVQNDVFSQMPAKLLIEFVVHLSQFSTALMKLLLKVIVVIHNHCKIKYKNDGNIAAGEGVPVYLKHILTKWCI